MVKTKHALIWLMISLFSPGFVSAIIGSDCSGKAELFYLSSPTNSHASLDFSSAYNIPVCLSKLTSKPDSGNIGLRLFLDTNSHASFSNLNYNVEIYVGEYTCSLYDGSGVCPEGSECLVTLSGNGDNSHVAGCIQNPYVTTVCCTPPEVSCTEESSSAGNCDDGIDNDCDELIDCDDPGCSDDPACVLPCDLSTQWKAKWLDSSGNEILAGENAINGSSVKLVVENITATSCQGRVNFTIKESDALGDTGDFDSADFVAIDTPPTMYSLSKDGLGNGGNWIAEWHQDESLFDLGDEDPEYIFRACLIDEATGEETTNCIDNENEMKVVLLCLEPECTYAYWADMEEADKFNPLRVAQVGDSVRLVYENSSLQESDFPLTFSIKEDDSFYDDDITELQANYEDYSIGKVILTWKITQEEFNKGVENEEMLDGEELGDGKIELFFKVMDSDSNELSTSGQLSVSFVEDNTRPDSIILKPKNREIYYVGEELTFSFSATDPDDELTFEWDFGDGTTSEVSMQEDTKHTYSVPQQKIIKLKVKDSRQNEFIERVSILIVDPNAQETTNYEFAFIDKPLWGKEFYGHRIEFNASSSFAVETTNCDGGIPSAGLGGCNINCLAGGCLEKTRIDESDPHIQDIADTNNKRGDYSDLTFSWTFDPGKQDEASYEATGDDGKLFTFIFPTLDWHTANLDVSYTPPQ